MLEFKECPEPDEIAREKGRKLFAGNVDFLKGVVDMTGLPPADRIPVHPASAATSTRGGPQ